MDILFNSPAEYVGKKLVDLTQKRNQQTTNKFSIDELIQQNLNNPYAQRAGEWFNRVLSPDYQAYSPEYKQQLYDTRSKSLIEDVFRPQEERFAARLATSGLSGSGVAADQWANEIMKGQNRMLADLLTEIELENLNLTRADQAQALSMFPALNPLNDLFTYKGILTQEELARLQAQLAKEQLGLAKDQFGLAKEQFGYQKKKDRSSGLGKLLGGVAGFLLGGPGGSAAGSGIGGFLDRLFS